MTNQTSQRKRARAALGMVAALGVGGCFHPATVAVHPITGRVHYTRESAVFHCDQAATGCQTGALGFAPIDATFNDAGLVFITAAAVYRCDAEGGNCSAGTRFTFGNGARVSAGPADRIVVVSESGELNLCSATACERPR